MAEPENDPGRTGPPPAQAVDATADGAPAGAEPLLQVLGGLWRDLPGLLSDRIELLSLELRRAGIALAQIVALTVVVGILGVAGWLLVCGVAVVALVALEMPLGWALAAALAVNLLAGWLAVQRIRALVHRLSLPVTRRHLMFDTDEPARGAAQPPPFDGTPR